MDAKQQIGALQKQAAESGVYEAVVKIIDFTSKKDNPKNEGFLNLVNALKDVNEGFSGKVKWEQCEITYENIILIRDLTENIHKAFNPEEIMKNAQRNNERSLSMQSVFEKINAPKEKKNRSIKIKLQDGTIIYSVQGSVESQKVSVFRKGPWVDRLKDYAETLEAEHEQSKAAAAEQARQEKLKPFSDIDF